MSRAIRPEDFFFLTSDETTKKLTKNRWTRHTLVYREVPLPHTHSHTYTHAVITNHVSCRKHWGAHI